MYILGPKRKDEGKKHTERGSKEGVVMQHFIPVSAGVQPVCKAGVGMMHQIVTLTTNCQIVSDSSAHVGMFKNVCLINK